ncbi:hypothetical protein HMPREF1292_00495 [Corynebacterium sp. KPL1995]|nr:hypothetical protein HMPREF1292_00495 [Corynebacterium sp. KPL1995]ERS74208.1 hypothetical protein HMPREF1290_00496 [Corynebacterium sp. KPL1989]
MSNNLRAGSSPHARGKRSICALKIIPCRLIPACAGKTSKGCPRLRRKGAHPRMRGENCYLLHVGRVNQRLIPACAGKT